MKTLSIVSLKATKETANDRRLAIQNAWSIQEMTQRHQDAMAPRSGKLPLFSPLRRYVEFLVLPPASSGPILARSIRSRMECIRVSTLTCLLACSPRPVGDDEIVASLARNDCSQRVLLNVCQTDGDG